MQSIDFVIPMVFPQDAQWQAAYAAANGNAAGAGRNVRFRSWGTEELLVRCCMKYMPWLRSIKLLLASETQVQSWMEQWRMDDRKLKIVFHREFLPEQYLPTFNVNTIEMWLHRIPELSETFIYSNDDFFPLSPLAPEDFFRDGLPCQHHDVHPFPAKPNTFQRFVKSGLDMVAEDWGKRFPRTWLKGGHSMQPMLKSTVEEVCRRHADRILKSFTLKRSDRNFNQYIFPFYQHLSGRYVDFVPKRQYVGPGTPTGDIAAIIRDPQCGIVCINDNENIADWQQRAAVVRQEIANKLITDNGELTISSSLAAKVIPSGAKHPRGLGRDWQGEIMDNNKSTAMEVLIIHYNTQELTEAAIKSLWKHTPSAKVTVFDNSDKKPFSRDGLDSQLSPLDSQLSIIDNTRGQVVDWKAWLAQFPDKRNTTANDWASAKHCYSVELCMDRYPDGFVLMDSDVLIKKDISSIIDKSQAFAGELGDGTKKFPVRRVMPMLCWINTPLLKQHGIRYFNAAKMWKLISKSPECYYDTGAWLLEAVQTAKLPYGTVVLNEYVEHYGHGSWNRSRKKTPAMWIKEHAALWQTEAVPPTAGKASVGNTRIYVCTHTDFKAVVSNPVYETVDARQWNDDRCDNGLHGSFYSELITYKHIAEREDLPEYVGFCAYRKYFSFMDNVPDMDQLFREYDAVATTPLRFGYGVREQYARCHNVQDLDIVGGIIRRDYPDFFQSYDRSLRLHELYACNMFIVRREDFKWMMKMVFDILDKYLEVVGYGIEERIKAYPQKYHLGRPRTGVVAYQYRIGGFIGERIVNALLRYRFKNIKHYDKIITQESAAK